MANLLILMSVAILWFFLLVTGGYMIAARRVHNDRSRVFFAVFAWASSYALLQKMFFMLREGDIQDYYYVLPLRELFFGQLCRYLFALYPLEVARPGWLTFRRWMLFVIPWLLVMAGYGLFLGFYQTPLRSFDDLLLHIDRPDVWVRILLLLFMFPVEFVWTWGYNARRSSAGRSWLRRMTLMLLLIAVAFVGNMLTRSVGWRSFHSFVYLCYALYVMYVELFVRIPVPACQAEDASSAPNIPVHTEPASSPVVPGRLEQEIRLVMEQQQLWREPDLMLDDLVQRVGSNRTYVTASIQEMGYTGFKDYLNRLRVDYIRRQLLEARHEKMQSLFYDAGYRSRSSAWRNFTAIVGCSPSEFEERNRGESTV